MLAYHHMPVMLAEILDCLQPKAGGVYLDGTIGGGGHAEAVLRASSPDGWLYGMDRDQQAVQAATDRLAPFKGRFAIHQGSFDEADQWISTSCCDGALLDLGVSSWQLDQPERGFSFQEAGPLDMRMDQRQELTAARLVNEADAEELIRIFREYGDEPEAGRLARGIVQERQRAPFSSTGQLAALIERLKPRRGRRIHPATQVFQALRMAVNDELAVLERGLRAVWSRLKPSGRLAVISFHSIEDRAVKTFGRQLSLPYTVPGGIDVPDLRQPRFPELKQITRKPMLPSEQEMSANPRARSARLRVFERTHGS